MIEKMTKYSFILPSGGTEEFLNLLQESGVMDITRSEKPVDGESAALLDRIEKCSATIAAMEKTDFSGDSDFDEVRKAFEKAAQPDDPAGSFAEYSGALATVNSRIAETKAEIAARRPWGEFDPETVGKLAELGYRIHYYKVPAKKFDPAWEELYALQKVDSDGKTVRFVTVAPAGEEYSFPVPETAAPKGPASEAEETLRNLEAESAGIRGHLMRAAASVGTLKAEYAETAARLDLYLAGAAAETAAENTISVLTGFAPTENDAQLASVLEASGVLYIAEPATEEDNPPVKLRNGKFAKMFEVLTGMYGMPVYGEFDPTPVLSVFFLLFFGLCMGDAGYGIILTLFGIGVTKKWIKIDMFKSIGPLITVLGVGTFLVGMVLGTAFGVNLYEQTWVPDILKKFMIPDSVRIAGFSAQMVLALGIGIFHICLAMTTKAILYTIRFGFRNTVSVWGWLILILGGILTAAGALAGLLPETAVKWAVIAIGVLSGLGIFIFNTPGRNPLANIGSGLWDTYNMATGILGDVLSYIRLYALGLAGGMLGSAFNTLGSMVLGNAGEATWQWLPFIIILLFGHTLNLLMSCLGAFVHPLRLTFVEYFKNAGYEGKGMRYRPLGKQSTENN